MLRKSIQIVTAVITNSYYKGFLNGTIYKGKSKFICVPGFNCYSCPGALGACPIGAFQAVVNSAQFYISFYLLGFFLIVGTFLGRFVCGWLCPFGLIQEWLYKIPFKKTQVSRHYSFLKHSKYVFLLIFVIFIPIFVTNAWGIGYPAYCKYICPVGTLEAGIPLLYANDSLRSTAGALFNWKLGILLLVMILSTKMHRFFCKYMCPLGAIYALFNKVSFYQLNVDKHLCTRCGNCVDACKMDVNPLENPNSLECIRCGACKSQCPVHAISSGFNVCEKQTDSRRF